MRTEYIIRYRDRMSDKPISKASTPEEAERLFAEARSEILRTWATPDTSGLYIQRRTIDDAGRVIDSANTPTESAGKPARTRKAFFARVMREGVIDTRKYRYVFKTYPDRGEVQRIELDKLDTVVALAPWETVYTVK